MSAHLPARLIAVLAMLLTSFTVVLGNPSPVAATTTEIATGELVWGIKKSWRDYIGNGAVSDGAAINPDGTYTFPVVSGAYDDESATTTLQLGGSVHWQAYPDFGAPGRWGLDTTFTDLSVEISPTAQVIRGTHIGYLRSDPGGELQHDENVVLAKLDITDATTDFTGGVSSWAGIAAAAGPGLSIYPEGTVVDRASIRYDGPGGVPDLGERFDRPGQVTLAEGARWVSASAASTVTRQGYQVFVSGQQDLVFVAEMNNATRPGANLVLRALDAQTMQAVGTALTTTYASTSRGHNFQLGFDEQADSLFYVTGLDSGNQTTVRRATWSRDTDSFSTEVVGRLVDTTGTYRIGAVVWNPIASELAITAPGSAPADLYESHSLFRFAKVDGVWQRTESKLRLPDDGPYGGAASVVSPFTSNALADVKSLAVARDGSYVQASASASAISAEGVATSYPALRLVPDLDAVDVQPIEGTVLPAHGTFGVHFGWSSAATSYDGSVLQHNSNSMLQSFQRVEVEGGNAAAGETYLSEDALPPNQVSAFGRSIAADATHGWDWVTDVASPDGHVLSAVRDGAVFSTFEYPEFNVSGFPQLAVADDGSVFLPIKDEATGRYGFQRLRYAGVLPTFDEQPASAAVELGVGEETEQVSFTSTTTGGDPGVDRQWQVRKAGESTYADLDGETGATLTLEAEPGMGGNSYRAVYTGDAGRIASAAATLTVHYAPQVLAGPASRSVTEGSDAVFLASVGGNPEPTVVWQRRIAGFWQDVAADDDNVTIAGDALTVGGTNLDQSGSLFRVKVSNSAGTVYSAAAKLTVIPATTIPEDGLSLDGVVLEWTGSEELQAQPPVGGSNYFSAGASDGDQATYAATQGAVEVLQVAEGVETPAGYATRAAHVGTDGHQLVRLSDGHAEVEQDGSATVTWDGTFAVNFYGGMVPFWLTDPVLTVDADGTGTLTADLDGYAASMENPEERTPLDQVDDAAVATFTGVEVDPDGRIEFTPEYVGVEVEIPADKTQQNRTVAGWGAWPQQFVDFHLATGLSSYWYSSGGSADPEKKPSPVVVDFTGAETAEPEPETRASTTTIALGQGSHRYGGTTTATVHVTAEGVTPEGTVRIAVAGKTMDARLSSGAATVALPGGLRPGTYPVTASYPGAEAIEPSNASTSLTVTKAIPELRLTLVKARIAQRQRARVTVVVVIPGAAGLHPAGQVVIRDGNRVIAARTLTAAHRGKVVVTLPRLKKGRHFLRATIGATPLLLARSSAYRTLVVR